MLPQIMLVVITQVHIWYLFKKKQKIAFPHPLLNITSVWFDSSSVCWSFWPLKGDMVPSSKHAILKSTSVTHCLFGWHAKAYCHRVDFKHGKVMRPSKFVFMDLFCWCWRRNLWPWNKFKGWNAKWHRRGMACTAGKYKTECCSRWWIICIWNF